MSVPLSLLSSDGTPLRDVRTPRMVLLESRYFSTTQLFVDPKGSFWIQSRRSQDRPTRICGYTGASCSVTGKRTPSVRAISSIGVSWLG
jgi:hypothetical protein